MNGTRTVMLLLASLAVLAAMCALAAAQTPPPSSGDWTVSDTTTFSDTTITITNGDVNVEGSAGHLQLTNVNLRFTGTGVHSLIVRSGARVTITGGSITSTNGLCQVNINSGGSGTATSRLDGVVITNTNGVYVNTWRAVVTNCTIIGSMANGITARPMDSYVRPLDISDNSIVDATGMGISIAVPAFTGAVQVTCVANTVNNSGGTGIELTASAPSATGKFYVDRNRVNLTGAHGIRVQVTLNFVELTFNDVWVKNATMHGVYLQLSQNTMLTRNANGIHAIGNGDTGVYIWFAGPAWDRPIMRYWNVSENKQAGVHFVNFDCATFYDGYNVNDEARYDYIADQTHLEIFRTTHRKAMADVNAAYKWVISWRYMHFRLAWQNGEPCKYNRVEFEDDTDHRVAQATSDGNGWLPNITGVYDWSVGPTTSSQRNTLTPFMTGGTQRLAGPSFEFDHDMYGDLLFRDFQTPDLKVEKPATNQVQNTAVLLVKGTCVDPHSGVKLVEISLDDQPNWNQKTWFEAEGLTAWELTFDDAPDGVLNVYVRAWDWASYPTGGFSNVTIHNVTIDTTAPNLTVRPTEPYLITNSSQLTVLGYTDPDVVSVSINGEGVALAGGSFNKQVVLIEGDNTIVVVATDFAGNIAKEIRRVRLDSIAPILIIAFPPTEPPFLRTNQQTVTIGGYTDLRDVNITVNNQEVVVTAGAWSHEVTLAPGANEIVVDAFDPAQNHRVIGIPVYFDNVPPDVLVREPTDFSLVNTSIVIVDGKTSTDIKNYQIQINGIYIGVDKLSGDFRHELTVVRDGPLEINITVEDQAGNVVTRIVRIEVDTTAPYITNLSIGDGIIVNTPNLAFSGDTEDEAILFVNSQVVQIVDGHFTGTAALREGRNEVEFRVRDSAGNVRRVTRVVHLDTVPARYELDTTIVGNITKTEDNFFLIGGTTEANVQLTFIYDGKVDEAYVDPAGRFDHTIILSKNQTTLVRIRVVDTAGNIYQNELTIERLKEEDKTIFEENPWILYGIVIIVVSVVVLFVLVRFTLEAAYKRKLKLMGGAQPAYGQAYAPPPGEAPPPPAPPRPQGRPLPRPPGEAEAPRQPPRPPGEGE